jgi:serine/threonine-protein kinase
MPLTAGAHLGPYEILGAIGAGGMGEVYRARDPQLERDVAIKILPATSVADPVARTRLLREARTASRLNHPNICTIYQVGEAEGHAFIAMELVSGEPLSATLRRGPLATDLVIRYGLQLADAVAHAHQHDVVHRDLKSANVMITAEGRVKVLDFGLARRVAEAELEAVTQSRMLLTEPGAIVGTLAYMPPEQLRGQTADVRSDVWALGAVLSEMASGELPFGGNTGFELSAAILNGQPRPLPAGVPTALRAIVDRCLEKEPARRYQNGGELRIALETVHGGGLVVPDRRPWPARRRWFAAAAAALIVMLAATGLNVDRLRERLTGARRIESIVVLPPENLPANASQDYYAQGLREELSSDLSRIAALKIISPSSAMAVGAANKAPRDVAASLGVDALVTESVERAGASVRVAVQLVDARTNARLWTESYDRPMVDAFVLQNEAARSIANAIKATLTAAEAARLDARAAVDPDALDLYLKGRSLLRVPSGPDGPRKAMQLLQAAVAKDSRLALAHAGIADAYAYLGNGTVRGMSGGAAEPSAEMFDRSEAAARRALELDPGLAEAHVSLGVVRHTHYDWNGAIEEWRKALELSPNLANARWWLANVLSALGRRDEALVQARRAEDLDPANEILGWTLYRSRQYEEAIAELRRMLAVAESGGPHLTLGRLYLRTRRYPEAIAEFERMPMFKASSGTAAEMRRAADAGGGRELAAWITEFLERQTFRPFPPGNVAWFYAMAGDGDRAFAMLDRGYVANSLPGTWSLEDPGWDPIRSDARFREFLRRINMPESLTRVPDDERIRIDRQ